jgi:hypothetical protein
MESFSVKELFAHQINQLWDDDKFKSIPIKERGYAIQDCIIKDALLFIGINPSVIGDNTEERTFYSNSHGDTHKYFKKFIEIHQETGIPWAHLDLLYMRETNQRAIVELCENKYNRIGYDFAKAQYLISKEIIELACPRIIIVNNTYARKWLTDSYFNKDCFNYKFDDTIGTYRIQDHPLLSNTPIFFTSMLTGQRALDLGSYERLKWHIKFVLNKR